MRLRHGRFYLKIAAAVAALLTLTGYAIFETEALFSGPRISIVSPAATTTRKALLTVEGMVLNAAFIYLNDRQIFVNEEGFFSEKLLIAVGYNIITLRARDRFNREKLKTLEVVRLRSNITE